MKKNAELAEFLSEALADSERVTKGLGISLMVTHTTVHEIIEALMEEPVHPVTKEEWQAIEEVNEFCSSKFYPAVAKSKETIVSFLERTKQAGFEEPQLHTIRDLVDLLEQEDRVYATIDELKMVMNNSEKT